MPATQLLSRLLLAIPTLFGVALIVFVLLRVVPGDPIAMMVGPGATDKSIAALRALYGLDLPIHEQFGVWIAQVVQGDFGTSISLRQDVAGLILGRLPATLELSAAAMALAVMLGIGLAVFGAYWRGRPPETAINAFSALTLAVPDFLWGLIFILVVGVLLPVMPISGRLDPRLAFDPVTQFYIAESLIRGEFRVFGSLLFHMVLPAVALALPLTAVISRVLKSSLVEALEQDYVVQARVKGFSRSRIILREALRNALIPTITLTGVQFTFLIGGTVLVERIFGYPGLGNLAISAVVDRDLPLIQGIVITFAILFIALNILTDATYALLNPRLRRG